MEHCGAPVGQIEGVDGAPLTAKQETLLAEFDNECFLEAGHVGDHILRRERDDAEIRWRSDDSGFGLYD